MASRASQYVGRRTWWTAPGAVWHRTYVPACLLRACLRSLWGIFVVLSLLRGWKVNGIAPDRYDFVGAGIVLVGVAFIMYAPRSGGAVQGAYDPTEHHIQSERTIKQAGRDQSHHRLTLSLPRPTDCTQLTNCRSSAMSPHILCYCKRMTGNSRS